jgi:hypothetical protein
VLGDRTIVAAPTRNGNFCVAFVGKRGRGWGGCRVRSASPDFLRPSPNFGGDVRAYLVGATITGDGQTIRTVSGETLAGPDAFLSLVYADGTREPLPMIWVGAPIRAGFYYHAIRKPHQADSRRLAVVELRARDGQLIARQVIRKPIFRAPLPRARFVAMNVDVTATGAALVLLRCQSAHRERCLGTLTLRTVAGMNRRNIWAGAAEFSVDEKPTFVRVRLTDAVRARVRRAPLRVRALAIVYSGATITRNGGSLVLHS